LEPELLARMGRPVAVRGYPVVVEGNTTTEYARQLTHEGGVGFYL
jgi:hypothetical protein